MVSGYTVEIVDTERSGELREAYGDKMLFSSKVDISGLCVELLTSDREHLEMWEDNFYSISDHVRAHAKVYSVSDPEVEMKVLYDPSTGTAFLFNFDYYGWIKSIALGISGNILEEGHGIFSVHGAALDIDGIGVTLIAPSKTGKTTQSWGMLRMSNAHLITDDWYFVRIGKSGRPIASGSEKNCYIDADIGDIWEEYKALVKSVRFDNKGRGIANVRWVAGESAVIPMTKIRYVFLLKRDHSDHSTVRSLTAEEATKYMIDNDLCNPHQIVRDDHKRRIRREFFEKYFSVCDTYMINTVKSPKETQETIKGIVEACGRR
ncbi:MAG: hypothetical protein LBS92_04525 [Candidatus Methanoplasma sp.]|jgi:hypothetical protein|nr:hypothetical protein [Candidatus Methanoplasma sp.]